ncbi:Protein phosphatase 1 regulatory subunit 3E [Tupaia chinensis]|uniref:Protein phosphatase 1 regulatory subunit 3E n=1 Tax=Tupaia chinensis TaxID=246437 RepID=L9L6A1_TUPCH|nr:Protein phosphatase 1 regulatory subunit 3E [Tupaia chinensis]
MPFRGSPFASGSRPFYHLGPAGNSDTEEARAALEPASEPGFAARLQAQRICLERAEAGPLGVAGSARVLDLAYEKREARAALEPASEPGFAARLQAQRICLERAEAGPLGVAGSARVLDLAYEKRTDWGVMTGSSQSFFLQAALGIKIEEKARRSLSL